MDHLGSEGLFHDQYALKYGFMLRLSEACSGVLVYYLVPTLGERTGKNIIHYKTVTISKFAVEICN